MSYNHIIANYDKTFGISVFFTSNNSLLDLHCKYNVETHSKSTCVLGRMFAYTRPFITESYICLKKILNLRYMFCVTSFCP